MISIAQAFAQWEENIKPHIPADDEPALAESWNDYTDSLAKDGELCDLQIHYCPAWDDTMPDEGSRYDALSGDRDFILDAMKVTLDAVFVPFSQSRNKADKSPSLNWRVTLKKDGREVITSDYMQGHGHTTAYKNPVRFPGPNRKLDQHSTNVNIRQECETGIVTAPGFARAKVEKPDVSDVLNSLLLDASALDSRDFSDWCAEMGLHDDSIKARAMYDACIETATKLRAAFGQRTIDQLRELFADM